MCDNKNELHQSEYDKSKDYTSTRLDLDITETTDSYPEFDFLDLLRNLQVKEKKVKHKSNSEVSSNKSNLFSDEDSDLEALAKLYEEKYGTCNDYAELGEGYDEEDSFIDNSDAVNDLVPSGIRTEFGGFYINRGKLNFVKEDNSSSSTSEDVDKFLAHNRMNTRRIVSDDENEEKEMCRSQSNIQQSNPNTSNIHSNSNNNNNNDNDNDNNINYSNNSNNNNNNNINNNINNSINNNNKNNNANNNNIHNSNNNYHNLHNNAIKSRKRSKEYQHKSKRIRKTATPKIPDHLLYKKPFSGSLEFRKNINEFKKNRLKTVETDKKCSVTDSFVNISSSINSNNNNNNKNNSSNNNNNNNISTCSSINSSSSNNNNNNNNSKNNYSDENNHNNDINTTNSSINNNNSNNIIINNINSISNNNSNSNNSLSNNISSSNNNNNCVEDNINSTSNIINNNKNNNNNNNSNGNSNSNNNNNNKITDENIDIDKKESAFAKKKPLTVKELLKERSGAYEEDKTGLKDVREIPQTSSSSESSESSSSESDSYTSEDPPTEKEKISHKVIEESFPKSTTINGSISKDITAKSFAHLSDGLNELFAKVFEISKEEKNKFFNSKLNTLLLSLNDKLRELPTGEKNAALEQVAEILQMKKDNITKRIKKLLVIQEEAKMSAPLRKLKEAVANIMPLLESNYFNEYTKAAGTSPQIYAELSRYYWSIDPGSLPQRKFPWNEELRHYLREIVRCRQNCYNIIRPRKENLVDYIRNFMEAKVKNFWPKEWITVDILIEEAQLAMLREKNERQKTITKILGAQNSSNIAQKKNSSNAIAPNRKQAVHTPASSAATSQTTNRKPTQAGVKNPEVKSILIPRKTPQGSSSGNISVKSNFASASSLSTLQNINQGSRLQVTLNRLNVQEYYDRMSGSQTSVSRNSHQQISPNRSQQSVSPNRLVKTSSPNSVVNSATFRSNPSQRNTSPNSSSKSISSSVRNCSNQQSILKTIGVHGNYSSVKTSQNSVTISPVNESIFKDLSPSAEVLNLTKNSSVYISKIKDGGDSRSGRSNSPSIGIPLPSGITISPTNASPSNFLAKPPKQVDKNSDVKINVSITKQDAGANNTKEKRETLVNINIKREGPLQNIPDCISVTSKMVPNERPKYEHVRKRVLHEYHQQLSPEGEKFEEKKIKTEENSLGDVDMKDDRLDDKNFSKIFDSVIAKTSETVRQSESASSQIKMERFSNMSVESGSSGGSAVVKNSMVGVNQFKNYPTKLRDVRTPKDKPFYSGAGLEEKNYSDSDDRSKPTKEQRVQMEMDRVMQNLVELSREKNPEYELGYPSSPTASSGLRPSSYQESYPKMLFK